MRKLFNHKILVMISSILTLIAAVTVSTACMTEIYQPKVPKCLQEK